MHGLGAKSDITPLIALAKSKNFVLGLLPEPCCEVYLVLEENAGHIFSHQNAQAFRLGVGIDLAMTTHELLHCNLWKIRWVNELGPLYDCKLRPLMRRQR